MIVERELLLLQRDGVRGLPADWVEQQWSDIQAIVQRCSEYVENVEAIHLSLVYDTRPDPDE